MARPRRAKGAGRRSGPRAPAILVRRAIPADAATIAKFNAAMALETEGKRLDPKLLRPGVEGLLLRPSFGFYLVAECAGKLVGQTMVTFEWSDWRNGPFFWLQSVFVEPAWRARGTFRALHDAVEREAKAFNACGLRLYVERENGRARSVYRHLGYATTPYRMLEKIRAGKSGA